MPLNASMTLYNSNGAVVRAVETQVQTLNFTTNLTYTRETGTAITHINLPPPLQ